MTTRTLAGKFKQQYTRQNIISYLKGVQKILGYSPVYRDIRKFPGPSPTTIIRQFKSWSRALKLANIRPHTNQLFRKERGLIRKVWHKMSDREVAKKLGVPVYVIRYHRIKSKLWKNSRKGAAKATQKQRAIKLYGKTCEVCNISVVELNHIISRKNEPKNWTILCPLCHAVLTRKFVTIQNRRELKTKLLPFMKILHESFRFRE